MYYYAKVISVHSSETAWHRCCGMYDLKRTKLHHTIISNWSDCYPPAHTCTCYRAIQNRSSLVRTHIPKLTHLSLLHPHKKRINLQLTVTQECRLCMPLAYMNMCQVGVKLYNCRCIYSVTVSYPGGQSGFETTNHITLPEVTKFKRISETDSLTFLPTDTIAPIWR